METDGVPLQSFVHDLLINLESIRRSFLQKDGIGDLTDVDRVREIQCSISSGEDTFRDEVTSKLLSNPRRDVA